MEWSEFHLHPVSPLEEALIKNSQKIGKRMDFRIMTKKNHQTKNLSATAGCRAPR